MAAQPAIQEGPGAVIGPYKLLEQIGEGGFRRRLHGGAVPTLCAARSH